MDEDADRGWRRLPGEDSLMMLMLMIDTTMVKENGLMSIVHDGRFQDAI